VNPTAAASGEEPGAYARRLLAFFAGTAPGQALIRPSGGYTPRMAQAKKITMYLIVVFVLYTIINSPARAADLVQIGFQGISDAAQGVGEFMTQLVN
jgi:hypothetical protein